MIIPLILTTLLIHFSPKGWENVLFELGSERLKRCQHNLPGKKTFVLTPMYRTKFRQTSHCEGYYHLVTVKLDRRAHLSRDISGNTGQRKIATNCKFLATLLLFMFPYIHSKRALPCYRLQSSRRILTPGFPHRCSSEENEDDQEGEDSARHDPGSSDAAEVNSKADDQWQDTDGFEDVREELQESGGMMVRFRADNWGILVIGPDFCGLELFGRCFGLRVKVQLWFN